MGIDFVTDSIKSADAQWAAERINEAFPSGKINREELTKLAGEHDAKNKDGTINLLRLVKALACQLP